MNTEFLVALLVIVAFVILPLLITILKRSPHPPEGDEEVAAVLAEQQQPIEQSKSENIRSTDKDPLEDPIEGLLVHNIPHEMTIHEVSVASATISREAILQLYQEIIGAAKSTQETIIVSSWMELELRHGKKDNSFEILGNRGTPSFLFDP